MKPHAAGEESVTAGAVPLMSNPKSEWLANLVLTLPFLILYWADLAHHTLFFDELNAWAIAAASPTLPKLFHLVHYEGHPWLWYFLLWLPSRFTHDPRAMLWIVAPVGTAIYLVVGMLSPFTRLQKGLVFLSYFVAFEYTVMNRMYCVMFLMALLYVVRRMRNPEKVVGNIALLGVMANTDMTGLLLSIALLLEYAYDRYQANKRTGRSSESKGALTLAVGIYMSMLLLSVLSLLPASDMSWQSTGPSGSVLRKVKVPGAGCHKHDCGSLVAYLPGISTALLGNGCTGPKASLVACTACASSVLAHIEAGQKSVDNDGPRPRLRHSVCRYRICWSRSPLGDRFYYVPAMPVD